MSRVSEHPRDNPRASICFVDRGPSLFCLEIHKCRVQRSGFALTLTRARLNGSLRIEAEEVAFIMMTNATIEEEICELRTTIANALATADRLGLLMVGINLNDALECLKDGTQDNA